MTREEVARKLTGMPGSRMEREGRGKAPVNIALCKYWGKRDELLNLPLTSSLSISLPELGAVTAVRPSPVNRLVVNGEEQDATGKAARRVFEFAGLFTSSPLEVESVSTVPLAAGLASSASGFAALTRALDDALQWQLPERELSILARMGSGSAARSIYNGFVRWNAGERADGMDSYAEPLDLAWPGFRLGLLLLSDRSKAIGSREAMKRTRETSRLYRQWPGKVEADLAVLEKAIRARDFRALGRVAESNALAMHATMIDSWPPVIYWLPETVAAIHRVHALRAEGIDVFLTMDAGPNVKLLFPDNAESAVRSAFPDCRVLQPFGKNN